MIIMEEWLQMRASTIIRGGYLEHCYVSENKNRPGHYIVEANEIKSENSTTNTYALENLIFDERVDPYGCRTSNIDSNYRLFGVNETAARCQEELLFAATNVSETKEILARHYKQLADSMLTAGSFRHAVRGSLRNDETLDPMRLYCFEVAQTFIRDSINRKDVTPVADAVPASAFGELPGFGTGISKVTIVKK